MTCLILIVDQEQKVRFNHFILNIITLSNPAGYNYVNKIMKNTQMK